MFTYIAYFNMCIHCNGYFICVTTCIWYINFKYKWKLYAHPYYGKFLLPKALFVICYKPPQLVCEFMYISIFCDRQSQTQVYYNDSRAAIILFSVQQHLLSFDRYLSFYINVNITLHLQQSRQFFQINIFFLTYNDRSKRLLN